MTVLLGLMLCEGTRTLSGLVRQIADGSSLAGMSRFLSQAPWEAAALIDQRSATGIVRFWTLARLS